MPEPQEMDRELAEVLRRHAEEIAGNMVAVFDRLHPDSLLGSLPMDERFDWIKLELERIIGVLLTGRVSARRIPYQPRITSGSEGLPWDVGDLLNVLENGLFIEESVLPVLWQEYSSDTERLYFAVSRFKQCLHTFIKASAASFATEVAAHIGEVKEMVATEERYRVSTEIHDHFAHAINLLKQKTLLTRDLIAKEQFAEAKVTLTEMKLIESDVSESVFGLRLKADQEQGIAQTLQKKPQNVDNQPGPISEAGHQNDGIGGLSRREIEVIRLIAVGESNAEIARTLTITENTVKHHLSSILEKLQLKNRTQVAAYALNRLGFSPEAHE